MASSRSGNLNSVFGAVDAAPYYPYYTPILDSVDNSLGQLQDYTGYVGGRSEAFDVEGGMPRKGSAENSSWMDPSQSSQMLLPSHKVASGESFSAYKESFGSWHGAHNDSSVLDHVGSDCSDWLNERHLGLYADNNRIPTDGSRATDLDSIVWPDEGSSYFYSPETTSVVKECDTFTPSPYERYISQLISHSRDPTTNYPAPTSLRCGYASSNDRNKSGSLFSCPVSKHGNSIVKHINTQKKDGDYKGHSGNAYENAEVGTSLYKTDIPGEATQTNNGTPGSYLLVEGLPSSNISTLRQSTDCSEAVNSGFKVTNLKSCEASISEIDAFVHDDFLQASLEIHDHLNVAVDSPCWKGASMSRQDPFGSDEFLESLVISATSCSDEFVNGQMSSEIQSAIKLTGTSVCNVNGKDIPSAILKDTSLVMNLSDSDCRIQDCTGAGSGSNPASLENAIEIKQQDSHEKYNVSIGQVSAPQVIDDHVRQLSKVRCIISEGSSNSGDSALTSQKSEPGSNPMCNCTNYPLRSKSYTSNGEMILSSQDAILSNELKKAVSSDASSKCFSQGQDSRALVKAMLTLSEILSCHYCSDNDSFEEDLKHVRQIIDNLESLILRNKKGITRVPRMEKTHLEATESNAGKISRKDSIDYNENKNLMRAGLDNKKHNNVKSFNTSFEYPDGIAQSFTKVLKSDFMEQEEDPKILLYKNLWMQTEAALCSLKHDVTLMKLEMGSFKHHFKGGGGSHTLPAESSAVSDSHGCEEYQVSNPTNTEAVRNHVRNLSKEDEIDASVISRFRILKGRHEADFAAAEENIAKGSYVDVEKGVLPSHNAKTFMVSRPNNIPPGEKLPGVDYRVGNGFGLNDSEPAGAQEFRLSDPKNHVKWLLSSGSRSPSSEWEHVLRDDFMQ